MFVEIIKPYIKLKTSQEKLESVYQLFVILFSLGLNVLTATFKQPHIPLKSFEFWKLVVVTSALAIFVYDVGYKKVVNYIKSKVII